MESIIKKMPNPLGRPPKFTPKKLWNKFLEYTEWVDSNPVEVFNRKSATKNHEKAESKSAMQDKIAQPYTIVGFITFAGISNWYEFKASERSKTKDFLIIIRAIENAIQQQQVSGAMVGIYNSNLTARLNGLADVTKSEVSSKVTVNQMSDEEIEAEIKRISESMSK